MLVGYERATVDWWMGGSLEYGSEYRVDTQAYCSIPYTFFYLIPSIAK